MIYFIQAGDKAIKIGWTENKSNMKTRLDALQLANYEKLKVIYCLEGDIDREKEFHKIAKKYHIRGEWFDKKVLKDTKIMDMIKSKDIKRKSEINPIKKLREATGLSMEDLASKVGVSAMSIYRWERGNKPHKVFEKKLKNILEA